MRASDSRVLMMVMLIVLGVLSRSVDVLGQQSRTITVLGTGTASAPPNYVVIKGTIHGDGETAEEAFKKFRELKIKVEKAITKELPDVATAFLGEKPILSGGVEGLAAVMMADGLPRSATFLLRSESVDSDPAKAACGFRIGKQLGERKNQLIASVSTVLYRALGDHASMVYRIALILEAKARIWASKESLLEELSG